MEGVLGLAPKAGGGSGQISEASAYAAPGSVVLAAGDALQDRGRAAAIDGVGVGAAVLVALLIRAPRHDRSAIVHGRIGPRDRRPGPAIFQYPHFGVGGNPALARAHLPADPRAADAADHGAISRRGDKEAALDRRGAAWRA